MWCPQIEAEDRHLRFVGRESDRQHTQNRIERHRHYKVECQQAAFAYVDVEFSNIDARKVFNEPIESWFVVAVRKFDLSIRLEPYHFTRHLHGKWQSKNYYSTEYSRITFFRWGIGSIFRGFFLWEREREWGIEKGNLQFTTQLEWSRWLHSFSKLSPLELSLSLGEWSIGYPRDNLWSDKWWWSHPRRGKQAVSCMHALKSRNRLRSL